MNTTITKVYRPAHTPDLELVKKLSIIDLQEQWRMLSLRVDGLNILQHKIIIMNDKLVSKPTIWRQGSERREIPAQTVEPITVQDVVGEESVLEGYEVSWLDAR